MATIDRIEAAYTPWSPTAAGFPSTDATTTGYHGRHRRPGARRLSLVALFRVARHRRR